MRSTARFDRARRLGDQPLLTIDQPDYFRRLADVEARHWWSLGLWKLTSFWLDDALRDRRGLIALDVGCGAGGTLTRLAARPEIDRVYGIDASPHALALAGRDNRLSLGSVLNLPFADESFDLIVCFDVLQHLPSGGDRVAVAEIERVLRPGGIALVRSNAKGFSRVSDWYVSVYDFETFVNLFQERRFSIRRATLANCLPAIAQEARESWKRLRTRSGSIANAATKSSQGLCAAVPRPWINSAMFGVAATEAIFAGKFGKRLPFGHSTLLLAVKSARSSFED